jgi:hypothetical protein
MRTSTLIVRLPPTRSNSRSWASELGEDQLGVLGGVRRGRIAHHELGQAARGGDRVAYLMRDARRQLANRGELLAVRQ